MRYGYGVLRAAQRLLIYIGYKHENSKIDSHGVGHRDSHSTPKKPDAASILYSVICDDTHGLAFEEWCGDYDYNPDSRKALQIYLDCQEQTQKAHRFFASELLEQLETMPEGF